MKFATTPKAQEDVSRAMLLGLQKVIAYGSEDAVRIAAEFQQHNYKPEDQKDKFRTMAFFALLAAQLKHDITGELISPEIYYKFFLTDYEKNASQINESINQLIRELKLRKELLVNCPESRARDDVAEGN